MIARVDGRPIDELDRRRLRRCDPMLGQPLVIDPMPGATCTELLASTNRALGVSSGFAARLRSEAKPLLPLRAWRLPALVILDADFLARDALVDLDALPGPRIDTIIATFDRPGDDVALLGPEPLRRIVATYCLDSDRRAASLEPGDRAVQRAGAVSRQVHEVFAGGVRSVPELALVSAAAAIFSVPRTPDATRLRLAGFDDALRSYGFRLVFSDGLVESARQARWPREWLLDALEPAVQRPIDLACKSALATPLCADDATVQRFLCGRTENSGRTYRRAIRSLVAWRHEHGVAPTDHRDDHIVEWGHDCLRDNAALGSVYAGMGCARSYYAFLRTGHVRVKATTIEPAPFVGRRDIRRQLHLDDPYEQPKNDARAVDASPSRGREHSRSARRLMSHKDWTAAQFRQAIDACFVDVDPEVLLRFCGTARHSRRALQRQVARLQGVVFVLMHDIAITALPPEVRAGSPNAVATWLKQARDVGPWSELIESLRHQPRFADIDWDRVL